MKPSTPLGWKYSVCLEAFNDYKATRIHGSDVCRGCIEALFEPPLKMEHRYPPTWDGKILHPKQFDHIISADFIRRYRAGEIEYNTPILERVYCNCGYFHGQIVPLLRVNPTFSILSTCGGFPVLGCRNVACMKCGGSFESADRALRHPCLPKNDQERTAEIERAFEGLELGKHWQRCPSKNCGRAVELKDGCNHMTCLCLTSFSFICGKQADERSGHWKEGGCPRYLHSSNPRAEYEGDEDEEEDEGEGVDAEIAVEGDAQGD